MQPEATDSEGKLKLVVETILILGQILNDSSLYSDFKIENVHGPLEIGIPIQHLVVRSGG